MISEVLLSKVMRYSRNFRSLRQPTNITTKHTRMHWTGQIGKKKKVSGVILTFILGIYSSTISASTGTMLTFVLTYLFGLSFRRAISNRPFITFIGFSIAVILLWFKGLVDIYIAIPIFLGRGLGGYLSANIVLKSRSYILQIIFSIVIIGLALKTLFF